MREGEEIEGGRRSKREKGIIDNECGARDRKRKGERGWKREEQREKDIEKERKGKNEREKNKDRERRGKGREGEEGNRREREVCMNMLCWGL